MSAQNSEQFSCAGCGAIRGDKASGGLWVPLGKDQTHAIPYLLCRACTDAMRSDPERMCSVVEDRLLAAQGHA